LQKDEISAKERGKTTTENGLGKSEKSESEKKARCGPKIRQNPVSAAVVYTSGKTYKGSPKEKENPVLGCSKEP